MRVLLSAIGSRGEVQPLVALALRLKAAGMAASFCVSAEYLAWVEGFGFPATPIGPEPWKESVTPKPGTSPEQRRQLGEATVANHFIAISQAARGCDVIVAAAVGPAAMPVARSVAEMLGIRYVYASFCPAFLPSPHQPPPMQPAASRPAGASNTELWAGMAGRFHAQLGPAVNRHRRLAGLAPVDDVLGHVLTSRPWLCADPVLAPLPGPADGGIFQTGAWLLPDDRPLPGDLEAFLRAGEPPVYFGFSSMLTPPVVAQTIFQAARRTGRRAIISSGSAGLPPGRHGPDGLVIGDVNLRALFGRVAAAVHHGGSGTTTVAALAGAPQVVIPQRFDQPYWAQRVGELGIGTAHAPGEPTEDSLTDALRQALQPDVAERARAVAAEINSSGAQVAAERLARGH